MQLRPFLPPSLFQSQWFVAVSGIVSLQVLFGAASFYCTVVYSVVAYSEINTTMAWQSGFMTRAIIVWLIFTCTVGPFIAIAMLDHVLQNRSLSTAGRSSWAVAITIGFGMVFYWYFHLINKGNLTVDKIESTDQL